MGIGRSAIFESLEPRRFLSATLVNGLLQITGTSTDDTIYLSPVVNSHLSAPYPAQVVSDDDFQRDLLAAFGPKVLK